MEVCRVMFQFYIDVSTKTRSVRVCVCVKQEVPSEYYHNPITSLKVTICNIPTRQNMSTRQLRPCTVQGEQPENLH